MALASAFTEWLASPRYLLTTILIGNTLSNVLVTLLVTNVAIPTLLLVLLLRSRRRPSATGADQVLHPVEQPAHPFAHAAQARAVDVYL